MYYVYILYSLKDKKFYTGKTSDLCERLKKQNNGLVESTRNRRPLKLVHCEIFKDVRESFLREKELKLPSAGRFKKELKERLNL